MTQKVEFFSEIIQRGLTNCPNKPCYEVFSWDSWEKILPKICWTFLIFLRVVYKASGQTKTMTLQIGIIHGLYLFSSPALLFYFAPSRIRLLPVILSNQHHTRFPLSRSANCRIKNLSAPERASILASEAILRARLVTNRAKSSL